MVRFDGMHRRSSDLGLLEALRLYWTSFQAEESFEGSAVELQFDCQAYEVV